MFRKTAICWLTAFALVVVAGGTMTSIVAQATGTGQIAGFVLFVPAHLQPSHIEAAVLEPTPVQVVSIVNTTPVTSPGWWGYCCTGDHSTHNTGSVPLLSP